MDRLIVHDMTTKSRRTVEIPVGRTVIGTGQDCGVVVAGSGVAAIHCAITRVAGGFEVTDLGSPRGTIVNGNPVERAVVREGDVMWVGALQLSVELDPTCEPGATPAPTPQPTRTAAAKRPEARPAPQKTPEVAEDPQVRTARVARRATAPDPDETEDSPRSRRARPETKKGIPIVAIGITVSAVFFAIIAAFMGGGDDKDVIQDPTQRLKLVEQLVKIRDFEAALQELELLAAQPITDSGMAKMIREQAEIAKERKAHTEKAQEALHRYGSDSSTAAAVLLPYVEASLKEFADLPEAVEFSSLKRALELRVREEKAAVRPDLADKIITAQRLAMRGKYGEAIAKYKEIEEYATPTARWVAQQGAEFVEQAASVHAFELHAIVAKALAADDSRRANDFVDADTVAGFQGTKMADIVKSIADDVHAKRALSVKAVAVKLPERVLPPADPNAKEFKPPTREGDAPPAGEAAGSGDDEPAAGNESTPPSTDGSKKPVGAASAEANPAVAAETKSNDRPATSTPPATANAETAAKPATTPPVARPEPESITGSDAMMRNGDFEGARARVENALKSAPPELVKRLEWRIACARLGSQFVSSLMAKVEADPDSIRSIDVKTKTGSSGRITGVSHGAWKLDVSGAEAEVPAGQIELASLLTLAQRYKWSPQESLERAAAAWAAQESKDFDDALEVANSDSIHKETIDILVALDRRVNAIPEYGFFRVEKKWLTFGERDQIQYVKLVKEAIEKLETGGSSYDKGVEQLSQIAPQAKDLVVSEILARRAKLIASVKNSPEWKSLDRLYEEKAKLEAARKHAFDLINDEQTYFYPYSPPAVPPDLEKKYHEVQKDVDNRVAAVRALWGDEFGEPPKGGVEISDRFRKLLKTISTEWAFVVTYAPDQAVIEQGLERLELLPHDVERMTIRDVAQDIGERQRLDRDRKVYILNVEQANSGLPMEVEQVKVTNDYRRMMGRSALAIHDKLIRAAHGHSEWMSKVGRLTHFNDEDPKLRTPGDRMRAQGYTAGAGENCAVGVSSALDALQGWAHSSGHHRNLLYESHTEMGVGVVGRYWTQNFGGGRSYEGNLVEDAE